VSNEAAIYVEGVRRGGTLLSARVPPGDRPVRNSIARRSASATVVKRSQRAGAATTLSRAPHCEKQMPPVRETRYGHGTVAAIDKAPMAFFARVSVSTMPARFFGSTRQTKKSPALLRHR
jgi:hypothetical protein